MPSSLLVRRNQQRGLLISQAALTNKRQAVCFSAEKQDKLVLICEAHWVGNNGFELLTFSL